MEELNDQINVVNCSATETGGLGQQACRFDWTRIKAVELTPRNFRYTELQTLEYIREQQQKGNITIINNVVSFVDASTDPNVITREGSGLKEIAGENPYEYNMTVDNGVDFWKVLRQYNSTGRYNIALYDTEGNKVFTQTKAGQVKGFGLGMFFTGKYKAKDGVASSSYATMLQYEDYKEMDRVAYISNEMLDFGPSDLDDVNNVTIAIDPIAVGEVKLIFSAKLSDKSHVVEGLEKTDYRITKTNAAGVTSTVVVTGELDYDTTPGKIEATITAAVAGDIFTIRNWDSVLNVPIILSPLDILYKSNIATVVTT